MVTVIIACWDRPEPLAMQLEYISRQTLQPNKVIVVDHMSLPENKQRQMELCDQYHVVYMDYITENKTHALVGCYAYGISYAETDFVCALDVDTLFDNDYFERCVRLMSRYENMALSNPAYLIPNCETSKTLLHGDVSLYDIVLLNNGQKQLINCDPVNEIEDYTSPSNDPRPGFYTWYFDCNIWLRTKHAQEYKIFDPKFNTYGGGKGDAGETCLINGLSIVISSDIVVYHMCHSKENYRGTPEMSAKVAQYHGQKWHGKVIPQFNDLIEIGG